MPLDALWRALKSRLDEAYEEGWHDAQLVAITYNSKLRYRASSVRRLRDVLRMDLESSFVSEHVQYDYAYVDLAYEDRACMTGGVANRPIEPITLLRKTECNLADMDLLRVGHQAETYYWFGTADIGSVRSSPGPKSDLRSGGLAYVQAYNNIYHLFSTPDKSAEPLFDSDAFRYIGYSRRVLNDI